MCFAKYVLGDFFTAQLPEADCYIVSHVLREYDDERVDIILGRIFERLNQGTAELRSLYSLRLAYA